MLLNVKSIKINAIFNSLYQILVLLAPLITTPYISRVLGVDAIGSYQFCYSIVTYFTILATFGFSDYGTKKISELRNNKNQKSDAFWEIMCAKGIISFICLLLYLIITLSIFAGTQLILFSVMSLYIISILLDPTFYFQGKENFVSISIKNSLVRVLTIILIFLIVKDQNDVVLYALALAASNTISAFVMYFSLRGEISKPKWKSLHIFEQFKRSFPFFLPSISVTLFTSLNQTLLGIVGDSNAISGYYAQAVKFSGLIASFVGSISIIMLSRISYLHSISDESQARSKISVSFHALWAIGMPCVFGICAISRFLIPIFLGEGYEPVIDLVYIVAPIGILSPLNTLYSNVYCKAYNKIWYQTLILIIASIVSIALNIFLIPSLGAVGCAIASLCAEIIQLPLYMLFSKRVVNARDVIKTFIKPFDSALIMFVLIYLLNKSWDNIFASWLVLLLDISIGTISYTLLMLILKDSFFSPLVKTIVRKTFIVICTFIPFLKRKGKTHGKK